MNKIFIFIIAIFLSLFAKAQHHDLTTGTLSPVFKHYSLTYEYIFENDRALGVEVAFGADGEIYKADFQATPYYRYYFGEDGNLFFTEAFVKIADYNIEDEDAYYAHKGMGIAPGVGFGVKGVFYEKFILGLNLGFGYELTKYYDKFAKRGALFVGYRF
jgi:hypothetical protein